MWEKRFKQKLIGLSNALLAMIMLLFFAGNFLTIPPVEAAQPHAVFTWINSSSIRLEGLNIVKPVTLNKEDPQSDTSNPNAPICTESSRCWNAVAKQGFGDAFALNIQLKNDPVCEDSIPPYSLNLIILVDKASINPSVNYKVKSDDVRIFSPDGISACGVPSSVNNFIKTLEQGITILAKGTAAPKPSKSTKEATWLNHSQIQLGDVTYTDPKIDDSLDYTGKNTCIGDKDVIDSFPEDGNGPDPKNANGPATLHDYSPGGDNNCVEDIYDVNFAKGSRSAYNIYFWWLDQGFIVTSDGAKNEDQASIVFGSEQGATVGTTTYSGKRGQAENLEKGSCKTEISVDIKAGAFGLPQLPEFGILTMRRKDGPDPPLKEGWPGGSSDSQKINVELKDNGHGCYESKPITVQIGNAVLAAGKKPGDGLSPETSTDGGAGCESSGVLGWIICPVVTTLLEGAQTLTDELVVPLLEIQPLNQQKNGALFEVWKNFRTLANIAFVLVFFVIIFSTAINNRE